MMKLGFEEKNKENEEIPGFEEETQKSQMKKLGFEEKNKENEEIPGFEEETQKSQMMKLGFEEKNQENEENPKPRTVVELGNGSEVTYVPRFLCLDESSKLFEYLDKHIPWTRPTIHVFGRSCLQPRDTCYVADEGLPELRYSGYQPLVHPWDRYPPLKQILQTVHEALPGSSFNSLLLNRYKTGSDYVAWHADDEKLYGPTPEIASISFGCEREFLLRKRPIKSPKAKVQDSKCAEEPASKRLKTCIQKDQHSFLLKHGSLLVMKGYTQRDWVHSVPRRARADAVRINLTFRRVYKV